jgi:hypothetical protein
MQEGSTVMTLKLSSSHQNGNSFLVITKNSSMQKIRMMIILFTYNGVVHHEYDL